MRNLLIAFGTLALATTGIAVAVPVTKTTIMATKATATTYKGSLHESDIYVRQQRTKPERQSVAFAAAPSSAL